MLPMAGRAAQKICAEPTGQGMNQSEVVVHHSTVQDITGENGRLPKSATLIPAHLLASLAEVGPGAREGLAL